MAISRLTPPRGYAGDPPSPFATGGRPLRIVVGLPLPEQGPDVAWASADALTMPDPDRLLWALGLRDDIEMYWISAPADRDAPARIELLDVDPANDHLPFRMFTTTSVSHRAVWPYSQWKRLAGDAGLPLDDVQAAAVAANMRADLLVTNNQQLLSCTDRRLAALNAMISSDALGVIGLYLRNRGFYEMAPPSGLVFGEHLFLWSAVRAMLPSGWAWGSALVGHGQASGRSSPTLLFGSLHQRLVRALRYRDQIHAALLVPQNNDTGDQAAEALDNFLVNVVGAFDAAARAAHLCAGLDPAARHLSGWQKPDWLKRLNVAELERLYAKDTEGERLFKLCRLLRNTVHGEGLQTTSVQGAGQPLRTFVALPEDDAQDLEALLQSLGSGGAAWGLEPLTGREEHLDPGVFVEALLPRVFSLLDETLRLTPVDRLGTSPGLSDPPDDLSFGAGTRARATMMLGLRQRVP